MSELFDQLAVQAAKAFLAEPEEPFIIGIEGGVPALGFTTPLRYSVEIVDELPDTDCTHLVSELLSNTELFNAGEAAMVFPNSYNMTPRQALHALLSYFIAEKAGQIPAVIERESANAEAYDEMLRRQTGEA